MKQAYPVILTQTEDGYVVDVPDFTIGTQGESLPDALIMARDAIGIVGIDMEDEGEDLPVPTPLQDVKTNSPQDILSLVDVDFTAYRRQNEQRVVRKNCSLPSWLNAEAERAGVNFSALLQAAIKAELNLN